jgi:hypothetical protein
MPKYSRVAEGSLLMRRQPSIPYRRPLTDRELAIAGLLAASGEWPPQVSAAYRGAASEPGMPEHAPSADPQARARPAEDDREAVVFLLGRAAEPGKARRV